MSPAENIEETAVLVGSRSRSGARAALHPCGDRAALAAALGRRSRALRRRAALQRQAEILRARDAAVSLRASCTWATCATTPSATRWRATCGCAATTCCTRWAGTPSVCRRKTPRSRTTRRRASGRSATSPPCGSRCSASASAMTGPTEITTCLPDYYRWNQWFFLHMYERGLAYRKKSKVNWCPQCATVLANEQVIDGYCWRHEDQIVEQRDLEQWFLRMTDYAQELLDGLDKLPRWPEKVRTMQRTGSGAAKARRSSSPSMNRPTSRAMLRSCRRAVLSSPGTYGAPTFERQSAETDIREDRGLHHAHRHDLRRDEPSACAGASAGHGVCSR